MYWYEKIFLYSFYCYHAILSYFLLRRRKIVIPVIKEPNFVTLSFVGDIMLDRGVKNSVNKILKEIIHLFLKS